MAILVSLGVVAGVYAIAGLTSPFIYWPTYRLLWRTTLTSRGKGLSASVRLRQIGFLLRQLALLPVWTALWYLDDLLYPAYRSRRTEPVFIVGQPRSGTTLLHRTLAADEGTFFAVRHIEWRLPFISVQKFLRYTGLASRLATRSYWPNTAAGRMASKMHPNTLADWEEDGVFFEERVLHHFFLFLRFPYPDILGKLDEFDGLPAGVQEKFLRVHQRVLQKIAYLRGRSDALYLSKEVTSHNKIPQLMRRYPGARFLVILRPSRVFMSSLLGLVRNSTESKAGVDPATIPSWTHAFVERMQKDSLRLVHLCRVAIPEERQTRVPFESFIRDVPGTVASIYASLAIPLRAEFSAHLEVLKEQQLTRDRGYSYEESDLPGFEDYDRFVADTDREFRQNLLHGRMAFESRFEGGDVTPSQASDVVSRLRAAESDCALSAPTADA